MFETLLNHFTYMTNKAVIEEFDELFNLYNDAGQCIESDFDSYEEADQWAKDNNYVVVDSFNF